VTFYALPVEEVILTNRYHLMKQCWSAMPEQRPSFTQVLMQLENFKRRSLDPNDEFSGRNITGIF
jgi:hypothetical protein